MFSRIETKGERLQNLWARAAHADGLRWLTPIASVYERLVRGRNWGYRSGLLATRRLACPVISVGNLTVGGAGKTPAVAAIARKLQAAGRRVVILSRGYGGRHPGGLAVVSDYEAVRLGPAKAGDEPYLLARSLPGIPVVIGKARARAGEQAYQQFTPDLFLLDDGFQHRALARDLDILLINAPNPWGSGHLFPRGSLREPIRELRRAHLIILSRVDEARDIQPLVAFIRQLHPQVPILTAIHEGRGWWDVNQGQRLDPAGIPDGPLYAFCGIAYPQSFFFRLSVLGLHLAGVRAFADHHRFSAADLHALEAAARATGAKALVTTEKDAVRLGGWRPVGMPVLALQIGLRIIEGEPSLDRRLSAIG